VDLIDTSAVKHLTASAHKRPYCDPLVNLLIIKKELTLANKP